MSIGIILVNKLNLSVALNTRTGIQIENGRFGYL